MRLFLLFPALFFLAAAVTLNAQNLEQGMNLYMNGEYEEAAAFFERYDSPEAMLYTGKSYYAMGSLHRARHYLSSAAQNADAEEVRQEAVYTNALADFQIKNFTSSLHELHRLRQLNPATAYTSRAGNLYNQILGYLSLAQMNKVFNETDSDTLRFDILKASAGRFGYEDVKAILLKYEHAAGENTAGFRELSRIRELLYSKESYDAEYSTLQKAEAPAGTSYKIGVVLPDFGFSSEDYEISQHLYFGVQQAVEDYNAAHADRKIFLKFRQTDDEDHTPEQAFSRLVWQDDADAIIGPLFSGEAQKFSVLSEEYGVPVITPLATSEQISGKSFYLYQLNPTFAVHGKKMAEFAVNTLRLDSLAIIAERGTPGETAAFAFQSEVQKLGAAVKHVFVEDLEAQGYSITDYVARITADTADGGADNIDGIYAPFSGPAAASLIQSLLTDLEASGKQYALLGLEEWQGVELSELRFSNWRIYYTQSYDVEDSDTAERSEFAENFRQMFSTAPNRFAFIGYDTARVLIQALEEAQNPADLNKALLELSNFKGISTQVSFKGHHVNQSVEIKRAGRN